MNKRRQHQRGPYPDDDFRRKHQGPGIGAPRQWQMPQCQRADRGHGKDRQHDDRAPRKDCRRHRHRRQDQDRERVLQSAGQIEQDRELEDVIAKTQRGITLAEPARHLAIDNQHEIEQHRAGDDGQRRGERQMKAETVMDGQDRQRLAGDRDPTDRDQRTQADPARAGGWLARGGQGDIGHGEISSFRVRRSERGLWPPPRPAPCWLIVRRCARSGRCGAPSGDCETCVERAESRCRSIKQKGG